MISFEQPPEAGLSRVGVAPDPALGFQHAEKFRHPVVAGQPLVHRASGDAAAVGMQAQAEYPLGAQNPQQFLLQIEARDRLQAVRPQLVQPVAGGKPAQVFVTRPALGGTIEDGRLDGLVGVPGADIVDGHMHAEIPGIDPQFLQLVGADQQMERQLFVAQVVADQLRQEALDPVAQAELQRALQIIAVIVGMAIQAFVPVEEAAIEAHVVERGVALPELLQVGTHQRLQAEVLPIAQRPVQPGTVDQLGRRHLAKKIQRMGTAAEIAAGFAAAARRQVFGVVRGSPAGVASRPLQP
ncbi:hypothetical protein D3C78_485280 [compost metagenome]